MSKRGKSILGWSAAIALVLVACSNGGSGDTGGGSDNQGGSAGAFLADTANYTFISKALTDMKIPTTGGYTTAIDHHLATNEMAAQFIAGSIQAYNLNSVITNYNTTTTDHYPVLSRYNVP